MGALYRNTCYATQADARAEICASFDAKVMATTNLYTSECTSTVFTGATMNICKRTNGGACTNQTQPWPVTPTCNYEGGTTLAYDYFLGALGFLVVVWGSRKLMELFTAPTIET